VWLLFSENPGGAALLGGGIVVLAVLFHLSGELWSRTPAPKPAGHRRIRG
jgi:hypothetical protein